jgi:hypothetical protein
VCPIAACRHLNSARGPTNYVIHKPRHCCAEANHGLAPGMSCLAHRSPAQRHGARKWLPIYAQGNKRWSPRYSGIAGAGWRRGGARRSAPRMQPLRGGTSTLAERPPPLQAVPCRPHPPGIPDADCVEQVIRPGERGSNGAGRFEGRCMRRGGGLTDAESPALQGERPARRSVPAIAGGPARAGGGCTACATHRGRRRRCVR